jgi:flagellar protein FliT
MQTATYLLGCYEDVAELSAAMVLAARDGDWEKVERLKQLAVDAINDVRALAGNIALSRSERRSKLAVMQRILMHDAEIRQLSQPWLRRMAGWMPNSGPSGSSLSGNLW